MVQDRIELIKRGNNLPICPACGSGNAMLDKCELPEKRWFECRDCEFTVQASEAVIVQTKLDKPSMGHLSTYSEINRYNGEDYF